MRLTAEQKREATLIAAVGCDRETAAKYVGCSPASLDEALRDDADFAKEMRRAEAGCELAHMRNVQQAARDERYWRASVWWLERLAPERYARRDADTLSRREVARFLAAVAAAIADVVRHEDDRHRVLEKLSDLAEVFTDPLLIEPPHKPASPEELKDDGEGAA